ncbi:sensor histidine kinase [Flavitalea sp. BT771]|uniref:sensor histidine kinase n=1 Tax=Flavitalea sp. BT771 TaxID=3063329 RepID=UPI0026E13616|nr:sensor histidine kinase [Flavitalea sp. BT771]MDO6432697.1 sensor histidine kinase [Flavitalea sp. BT771]MDV6222027.1 sensor histidine kinase [Flavitalea sp. BT771]
MERLRMTWTVAGFFVFYFFLLQLANDWQYRSMLDGGDPWKTFRYRLITIPLTMLPYYLYYRWQVPLLLKNKLGRFLLSVLLFIVLFDIYLHLTDWLAGNALSPSGMPGKYPMLTWKNYHFPRQSLHFTFINLFALAGFAYFLNRWEAERIIRRLKEQQLQLQLDYLKAQLHPHFFFNTLNNIYSLALYQSEKTAPMVDKLSQLMRYIVYNGKENRVPLQKEIEFLQNFVQLENIRHDNSSLISFTVQGDVRGICIPPLLFMPIMENGFKHGLNVIHNPWMEAGMLIENNEIIFEVKNSHTQSTPPGDSGIGLENLRQRLELLYPNKHTILVQQTAHQFEVNLTLMLS